MATRSDKITARWWSERVQRETTLVRWGAFGQPVLLFPTAGGDAEGWQLVKDVRLYVTTDAPAGSLPGVMP